MPRIGVARSFDVYVFRRRKTRRLPRGPKSVKLAIYTHGGTFLYLFASNMVVIFQCFYYSYFARLFRK